MEKPYNYDEEIRKYHSGEKKRSELPEDCKYYLKALTYIKKHPECSYLIDLSKEDYDNEVQRIKSETISNQKKEIFSKFTPEQREAWAERSRIQFRNMSPEDLARRTEKQIATWRNKSPEEKAAHAMHTKLQWQNMTEDERRAMIEKHKTTVANYSDEQKLRIRKKQQEIWNNKSDDEKRMIAERTRTVIQEWRSNLSNEDRQKILMKQSKFKKEWWDGLSDEYKIAMAEKGKATFNAHSDEYKRKFYQHISECRIKHWESLSDEDKEFILQRLGRASKLMWENMTPEEKASRLQNLVERGKEWRKNLSPEKRKELSDNARRNLQRWRDGLTDYDWFQFNRSVLSKSSGKNKFHRKFENLFMNSLGDRFYLVSECLSSNGNYKHFWDYGIFDENGDLVMLIDLDGEYFHGGDRFDYDGIHSRLELDRIRGLSVPPRKIFYIIAYEKFDKMFAEMSKFLGYSYEQYVDELVKMISTQPFPEPHWDDIDLLSSYGYLDRMNPFDNYHNSLSINTRLGDKIVYHFHKSIWHHGDPKSPYEFWRNINNVREMITDGYMLSTMANPNKILQGFDIYPKCTREHFISAGKAKIIISKYLNEYDEIFNPNNGYSGIMLAVISFKKSYVGIEEDPIKLSESNSILEFLHDTGCVKTESVKLFSTTVCRKYQAMFTHIDDESMVKFYMERYNCEVYVFAVGNSDKVLSLQSLATDIPEVDGTKANAVPRLQKIESVEFDENY